MFYRLCEQRGSVQFSSVAQSCLTLYDPMDCSKASLSITNSWSLLKLISIQLVMPSNHLILCLPLLLLPSVFPSIRVFSKESVLHIRRPNYWSFNFSISPSNKYSALIYFRMDRFDFFAVQGTLKSLFQHYSSKTSILQHSAFFMVHLLHPYMTTGKTIALTRWTYVSKVMSLLFNKLSRFVIAFLPRSKHHLISRLQSPSLNKRCEPAISVVSSAYGKLLIFLPAILISACASSSWAFHMMYSACKLNKQGENIQPWCTPFPIWNQSIFPCPVLTVASRLGNRFFRGQVRWSSIPFSFIIFHSLLWSSLKGSSIVNEVEVKNKWKNKLY